ncbi:MAG: hypothetical protein ACYSU3_03115, partial [Planctomycetota bacterium]
ALLVKTICFDLAHILSYVASRLIANQITELNGKSRIKQLKDKRRLKMKHVSIVVLIVMVSMASCAKIQQKELVKEGGTPSFQPEPLDDEWSKWLVGEWKVVSEETDWLTDELGSAVKIDVDEEGAAGFTIELGLNGQFLIMRGSSGEMTDEEKKHMKEAHKKIHVSDEDWERFLSMPYKSLVIQTIDPKTGERIAYSFDSQRCIAKGTGRLEGNKEIMEWEWSVTGQGVTNVSIVEKINDNKFTASMKYTLPNGNKTEEKIEMIRKQETTEK